MAAVELDIANQLASEGIITVLASQMATSLTAVKASGYNANLPLPAPAKYFEIFSEERVEAARNAGRVACFVYQQGEMIPDEWLSNSGADRQMIGRTPFGVVVAFHTAQYEPWSKPWDASDTITTEEVMTQRARAYAGGVIRTVLKHACTQTGITGIELSSNDPAQVEFDEENRPVVGYSHTVFDVLQHVKYSSPQALP